MRTDVHSPKNVTTEDYEFLACGNRSTAELDAYSPIHAINRMVEQGYRFDDVHGGHHCSHCGSFLTYYAILLHIPSKTMIHVGETCLDSRFSLASTEFHTLRKQAKLNRERTNAKKLRDEFAAEHQGVIEFLEGVYENLGDQDERNLSSYKQFLISLAGQLRRNGKLSEAQVGAVRKAIVRDAEFKAKREAERANETISDVIEGKLTVVGQMISSKWQDNEFGGTNKMLVQDARGFKVWASVPRGLDDALAAWLQNRPTRAVDDLDGSYPDLCRKRCVRVQFDATLTRSRDDSTFGFSKRPTKGLLLSITTTENA